MPQVTIEQVFQIAIRHHQSGQLQQVESLYRQILAQQPYRAGALHYLGVMAHRSQRFDVAVDFIRQVIAIRPQHPQVFSNLSNVLRDAGRMANLVRHIRLMNCATRRIGEERRAN